MFVGWLITPTLAWSFLFENCKAKDFICISLKFIFGVILKSSMTNTQGEFEVGN